MYNFQNKFEINGETLFAVYSKWLCIIDALETNLKVVQHGYMISTPFESAKTLHLHHIPLL